MVLSVQPDEGASLRLVAKVPGQTMSVRPVQMEFKYGTSFLGDSPEAYERLLHDALLRATRPCSPARTRSRPSGGSSQPILDAWESGPGPVDVRGRQPGAAEADELLAVRGTELEADMRRAVPETDRWSGEGVHVEQVVRELDRLHRELHATCARARRSPVT